MRVHTDGQTDGRMDATNTITSLLRAKDSHSIIINVSLMI